jgi:hypothetical protein
MTKMRFDGVSNPSAGMNIEIPIVLGGFWGELDLMTHSGYSLARFVYGVNSSAPTFCVPNRNYGSEFAA